MARTQTFKLRLNHFERQLLDQLARSLGRSRSDTIRRILLEKSAQINDLVKIGLKDDTNNLSIHKPAND